MRESDPETHPCRMVCWHTGPADRDPEIIAGTALAQLRVAAVAQLTHGIWRRIDLQVWNIELSDWVRLERLEA